MLEKLKKVFFFLVILGQIIAYGALFYLEKLTHSSAGVNHHLYYQKSQYMAGIFKDSNLLIIGAVSAVLILLSLICVLKSLKIKNYYFLLGSIVSVIWNILLERALFSDVVKENLNYPYLLMVLMCIVISALINMWIANKIKKKIN